MKKLLLPLVALLFLSVGAKATLVTNNFQNVFFAQGIAIYTNNYYSFSIDVNNLTSIFFAVLLIIIGRVMQLAQKINDDQEFML